LIEFLIEKTKSYFSLKKAKDDEGLFVEYLALALAGFGIWWW
jgi:hypothetical protein